MERVKSLLFDCFYYDHLQQRILRFLHFNLEISLPWAARSPDFKSIDVCFFFFFSRTRALRNIVADAPNKMLLCHLSLSVQHFYVLNTAAFIALCGLYIRHVNADVAGFKFVTGCSQFIVLSIIKRVLYQLHGLYRVT